LDNRPEEIVNVTRQTDIHTEDGEQEIDYGDTFGTAFTDFDGIVEIPEL
jgi:hypothetical protein